MNKCFVIQPFDNDTFDKRYTDIFQPAIEKAGLEPYRVDKDLSVRIPIDEIEKQISESAICFAEITTDNPNVWYELGFAFACKKDVVMVCSSDERKGLFPFDIRHKAIINYKTSSTSDFKALEDKIVKKIKAIQETPKALDIVQQNSAVIELENHEIDLLIILTANQPTNEDSIGVYHLQNQMSLAGYQAIATSVAIKVLVKKGLIRTYKEVDNWNNGAEIPVAQLTEDGENWILNNQIYLKLRRDDNLPF
jgi:hypothetical protein